MTWENALVTLLLALAAQVPILIGAIALWFKSSAAYKLAQSTNELAAKTEEQTNNRLSTLDGKVASHEIKCIESQKREAELNRQIAELKLALVEAKVNRS